MFQVHVHVVSGQEAAVLERSALRSRLESAPLQSVAAAAAAKAARATIAALRAAQAAADVAKAGPIVLLHASRGDFSPAVCGAKSLNVAKLHGIAASSDGLFTVPPSVTLPFGTCEALLALPENADVAAALERNLKAAYAALDAVRACLQRSWEVLFFGLWYLLCWYQCRRYLKQKTWRGAWVHKSRAGGGLLWEAGGPSSSGRITVLSRGRSS